MRLFNITEPNTEKFNTHNISAKIDFSTSVGWNYDQNEVSTIRFSEGISE